MCLTDENRALRNRVRGLLETATFRLLDPMAVADLVVAVTRAASFEVLPSVYQRIILEAENSHGAT